MKRKMSVLTIVLLFFVVTSAGAFPAGQPFQEIRDAIDDLWTAVDQLSTGAPDILVQEHSLTLDPWTSANIVKMCPQDTHVIGGSCWFDKDPVANGTVVVHDGFWYGNESWNCYVVNNNGVEPITVRIVSLCKSNE